MSIRKAPLYFLLLGVLALTFGAGYIAYPLLHGSSLPVSSVLLQPFGVQDMDVYWEAWKLLDRYFYGEKPDSDARTYGAVSGMVRSFGDPYTYFVEPAARELERDEMRGSFGGIGPILRHLRRATCCAPIRNSRQQGQASQTATFC